MNQTEIIEIIALTVFGTSAIIVIGLICLAVYDRIQEKKGIFNKEL